MAIMLGIPKTGKKQPRIPHTNDCVALSLVPTCPSSIAAARSVSIATDSSEMATTSGYCEADARIDLALVELDSTLEDLLPALEDSTLS